MKNETLWAKIKYGKMRLLLGSFYSQYHASTLIHDFTALFHEKFAL